MQLLLLSMHPHPRQPRYFTYLALSLLSGTASLYFFQNNVFLFLAWYMFIVVSDLHERYGPYPRTMAEPYTVTPTATMRDAQPSNISDRFPETVLPPLGTFCWPTKLAHPDDASKPWYSLPEPPELCELPKDELPNELRNIINWSLIRNARKDNYLHAAELPTKDFSYLASVIDSGQSRPVENATQISDVPPEDPSHRAAAIDSSQSTHTETSAQVRCIDLTDTEGDHSSVGKARSRVKVQMLGKFRHQLGIKASMIGVSSGLEDSLERTRCTKAGLDAKDKEKNRTVECASCFVSE